MNEQFYIFEESQYNDSEKTHLKAQEQIYPKFFNGAKKIEYISTDWKNGVKEKILDVNLSIDRQIKVYYNLNETQARLKQSVQIFKKPDNIPEDYVIFSISERFRKAEFQHYQDFGIGHFVGKYPREFYELQCDYFLYGYRDDSYNLIQAIIIDVTKFKKSILEGKLKVDQHHNRNNYKNSYFMVITFDELRKNSLIEWEYNREDKNARRETTVWDL